MGRDKIKESMKGYERIKGPEFIKDEAAINLVTDVLTQARLDYIAALKAKKKFDKIKNQRRLTTKELKKYREVKQEIVDCEEFYLSDTFVKFTLGVGPKGKDVIKKLRNSVGLV